MLYKPTIFLILYFYFLLKLKQQTPTSIFGSEYNNWLTNESNTINTSGIVKYNYQSLSRRNVGIPSYFIGPNTALSDIYERGYIFNVDSSGQYSYTAQPYPNKFLVSAPYHFYFGLIKGSTAMDLFITKYVDTTKVYE